MTAKYQFFKNPPSDKEKEEGESVLHARIVDGNNVCFKTLCERIAGRSTFSTGEVAGIMSLFKEELVRALMDGDRVEVEGVGDFSAVLKCPPIHHPKEIRAESIHFSRVVFKACKELREELSLMRFERATERQKSRVFAQEERRSRILLYLKQNAGIQSSDCMGLNDCTRYVALVDLKYLREQGLIVRLGGPKVAVYVLPDKQVEG